MTDYLYRAYNSKGAVVSGEVAAQSRAAALAKLRGQGLIPFHAAASSNANFLDAVRRPRAARLSRKSAALFYRQLATLLGAELRIDQALAISERLFTRPEEAQVIARIRDKVREGRPLSSALQGFPQSFQPYETALFRNGEVSGDMAAAAAMAADLLERSLAVRAKLASAMIYPAILTMTAVGAMLVITLVLAPTILPMYERGGQSPPPAFAAIVAFSAFVRNWWWAAGLTLVGGAAVALRTASRPAVRAAIDRTLLQVPLIGRAAALSEAARLTRTLSALLKSGAPLPDALGEAADALRNVSFRDHCRRSRESIRQGAPLSRTMGALGAFPPEVLDFVIIGEHTGRLSALLANAADYAEANAARTIDRVTTALSPLLTLLMGVLVGSLIAIVLSAILDANELLVG